MGGAREDTADIGIRPVETDADRVTFVRLVNTTTPDEPTSLDYLTWEDATYPGGVRLIATLAGEPVGAASVGRIFMHPPEFDGLWASLGVIPEARLRGVGTRLLDAVAAVAVDRDKGFLHITTSAERPEGIAFLAHRGFSELERYKMVRLDLAGLAPDDAPVPAGVTLTTLGERPDLVEGIHAVAEATFKDIPSADEPITVGDLAEFRARDVDKLPGWGFVVAVEDETGEAVGYASLYERPDGTGVYWHDMTAVVPRWRGRGLATALKLGTIHAAIEHGVIALETGNDTANAPMRAVNARLGYRPLPDSITMRGPVARGIMAP
jgi:mycothiol synthase